MKKYEIVGKKNKDCVKLQPAKRIGDVKPGEVFYLRSIVEMDIYSPGFLMLEKHSNIQEELKKYCFYIECGTNKMFTQKNMDEMVYVKYQD